MGDGRDRASRRSQQHAARRKANRPAAMRAKRKRRRVATTALGGVAVAGSLIVLMTTFGGGDESVAASRSITVRADDFSFTPNTLRGLAGEIDVTLKNDGPAGHDLVILRPGVRITSQNQFVQGTSLGEIPSIAPGSEFTLTVDLEPGLYQVICLLPGHLEAGMTADLVVE